jgi:hypothetical protein
MLRYKGKYRSACKELRNAVQAEAVIIIVVGGMLGDDVAYAGSPEIPTVIPEMLRALANDIEKSIHRLYPHPWWNSLVSDLSIFV